MQCSKGHFCKSPEEGQGLLSLWAGQSMSNADLCKGHGLTTRQLRGSCGCVATSLAQFYVCSSRQL